MFDARQPIVTLKLMQELTQQGFQLEVNEISGVLVYRHQLTELVTCRQSVNEIQQISCALNGV